MRKPTLLLVAHTNLGSSLSGGDRIFLNLIRYWQKYFDINFLASAEAQNLANKFKLNIKTTSTTKDTPRQIVLNTQNLFIHHTQRFFSGLIFCLNHRQLFKKSQYIYTSSDFYGDFVFGIIAKFVNPNIKWLCGYYLLAPNPFNLESNYVKNHQFIRGFIYYLAQRITIILAKKYADFVFVTSLPDVSLFQNYRLSTDKILIVQGGVYIPSVKILKSLIPVKLRPIDAIFIGRLHSQKGVIKMIDIWKLVVKKLVKAKLTVIGDGELKSNMVSKIKSYHLQKNIHLVGFMIGKHKFDLIKNSKIVLHPATFDSGGMAAAEAMAWGLPGVCFDLPALRTYYPIGMVKTKCFNNQQFANNIIKLLTDSTLYTKYSDDSRRLIITKWNWKKRLIYILNKIR